MLQRLRVALTFAFWLITPLMLSGCFLDDPVDSASAVDPELPTTNNNAPTISGNPPNIVKVGVNYSFIPTASDPDSEPMLFNIRNQPNWANFDSATGHLSGVPLLGSEGTYDGIVISVSAGSRSTSMSAFLITVESATTLNLPPEIDGFPPAGVTVGNNYSFTPSASDPDGDLLTFTVQNRPAWASFDTGSGRLSGIPQTGDDGAYTNISISVSDGTSGASMPAFSVVVEAQNSAPVLSGTPNSVATVGAAYSFTMSAFDPDADMLAFSIIGLPVWASFDPASGRLFGTPGATDIGTHGGIVITVSDGEDSASRGPYAITVEAISMGSVTLNWMAPTENVDGSPLIDLAGYKFYWGTSSGTYPNSVTIGNPGLTTYVIENLAPGTYEFVSTSFNSAGVESAYSNTATKTVP